jgi:hypothetical protein
LLSQTRPEAQLPQVVVPPQPSGAVPHTRVPHAEGSGVHPHSPGTPPPPHDRPLSQVDPEQQGCPLPPHDTQVLEALQICPEAQPPQFTVLPQLSTMLPHLPEHDRVLVQPHAFGVPPPPHVSGEEQSPSEQQPVLGMQFVVPGHRLNPVEQLMSQFPSMQTAEPLEEGVGQLVQETPQWVASVSE